MNQPFHRLSGCRANAGVVRHLQVLMKTYPVTWHGQPTLIEYGRDAGKLSFGLDYSACTPDQVRAFDLAWNRIEMPVVESVKVYTLTARVIRYFRRIKSNIHQRLALFARRF